MTILFESAIRVTLIAAIIALVLFTMRIKTASVQHAVWASVVVLMMLLPAWLAWGPKAPLPILPPQATPVIAFAVADVPVPAPVHVPRPSAEPIQPQISVLMGVYVVGLLVLLLRLSIGTVRASHLTSTSCVVPVTVGFLHPRIILPKSSHGWPQAQLDAVLAHEGEHIRRRDPLFQ